MVLNNLYLGRTDSTCASTSTGMQWCSCCGQSITQECVTFISTWDYERVFISPVKTKPMSKDPIPFTRKISGKSIFRAGKRTGIRGGR